ncbi:MAG: hypothetical protein JHC33_00990 [Ignisphaera sp.]|nr:hypothetical protein [Ignisphaera sp.]
MSLEVLEKFAQESGSEELLNAVKGVKGSMGANLDRMSYLEKELQGTISKRDRQAELVKSKLGLEELTEEALEKALSSKTKSGSAEFEAEKRKLEDMVSMLQTEKESLNSKHQSVMNQYKIERGLNDLGASSEVNGSKAYDILLSEVTSNASFDGDTLVFRANDGTTIRNADGTPMSLADPYNQLKDSEELKFLFLADKQKSGSGTQNTKGGGNKITSLAGLNDAQRLALYRNDPELFKKLSQG